MKHNLKYWIRLLSLGVSGGMLCACLLIELSYIVQVTRPAPSVVGKPPRNQGQAYQPVTLFNDQDQIPLSAWYLPPENGAVIILLHGFGSNRLEMVSRAEILAQHGYGVLLYDLRGHGESGGEVRAFGWQDVEDVSTALEFLSTCEEVDPTRIGILGFSTGGQIAIRATAEYEQIRAIIADDPGFVTVADAPAPSNTKERLLYLMSWIDGWGVQLWTGTPIPAGVIEEIGAISPRPILLIGTGQAEGSVLIRHYYETANEPKYLWEIPETYHGGQFEARPLEYEERMITFFDGALLEK